MSFGSSHGSVGDLSAFVASNAPAIKLEWQALLPQLINSMNGKILVQELNHAPNFESLLEPIAQALAQYKIYPNLDEFIDTLKLCTAEHRKPRPTEDPTPEMKMEQLWQIPTFNEDLRMVNRRSSLLSFKKMVDGAFSMFGRPSAQEIESKSSAKLAIPAGTLYSGGYSYANDATTVERASKLEEARKTMFAKKTVVEAGVPPTVTSFTPYQTSFDTHSQQPPQSQGAMSTQFADVGVSPVASSTPLAPNSLASTSEKAFESLFVKTLTGKTIEIKNAAYPSSTIAQVKILLRIQEGIPEEVQRLIHAGRELENKADLADYNIQDGSFLHLILRLRGNVAGRESRVASKVSTGKARHSDSEDGNDSSDDDPPVKKKKPIAPKTAKKIPVKKMTKRAPEYSDDSDEESDSSEDARPIEKKKTARKMAKKIPVKKAKPASGFSDDSDEDSDSYGDTKPTTKASFTLKEAKPDPSKITKTASSSSHGSPMVGWTKHESVFLRGMNLVESGSVSASTKIAGFDMDSTLISVKSGAKFPKDANDWKWMCDAVVPKIRQLQLENYRIVIFTNQGGIESGKQKSSDILEKIDQICAALGEKEHGVIFALVASCKDQYRKPSPFLWDLFVQKMNQGTMPDASTFYVGDAAGRKKRDHSCADRSFAFNAGIRFMTEDAFFLGASPQDIDSVPFPEDPRVTEFKRNVKLGYSSPYQVPVSSAPVEIVLMCGMPGSGKSTIYQQVFEPRGYVHINLDTIKVATKCFEMVKSSLNEGKSVLIDQTFPDVASRAGYVELAKSLKVPIRIVNLQTPLPIAMHLNTIRSWTSDRKHVPDLVYHIFAKKYVAPTTAEGFDAVHDLAFQFASTDPKAIASLQWYTE